MNRRSFFNALAVIALAPQLAFRVKPLPIAAPAPVIAFWSETERYTMCTDEVYELKMEELAKHNHNWDTIRNIRSREGPGHTTTGLHM